MPNRIVAEGAIAAGALRVVVVDDHEMTVKLACYVFREAGWRADGFTSPRAALEAMKSFEPDLIVSDFRMPELSGPDFLLAAERLHELTPRLIMTAYDDEEAVQVALRRAGVPSVEKAKGLTELLSAAQQLVAVRRSVKARALSVGAGS